LYVLANLLLGLDFQKQASIISHREGLQILANDKALLIDTFLESQKEKYSILASMNVFKQLAKDPTNTAKIDEARKRINELKDIFPGIALISKEGFIIIAESNPAGTDYSEIPGFPANDESTFRFMQYYDLYRKKDYYGAMGPIYDTTVTTKVTGVIGFDIALEKISALMKETLDSKTNEVYLLNQNGLLLSGSEYIGQGNKNGVLLQEVKSPEAKTCLTDLAEYGKEVSIEEHEEKNTNPYKNYMGDDVFGAHSYVPSIMGCVIAEESTSEVISFSLLDYFNNLFNE
jgi:hypothetical protein